MTVFDDELKAMAERGPRLTRRILDLVNSMDEVQSETERAMLLMVAAHAVAVAAGISFDTVVDLVKAGAPPGEN